MKRIIFLIWICFACMSVLAQTLTFSDEAGCAYKFKILSKDNRELALVEAANKGRSDLLIPGTINYKGVDYTLVKVLSESLRKCDRNLRKLSFPSTVREIEGFLFGSGMKLMGGLRGAISGGVSDSPLSSISLESLVIPREMKEMGSGAFYTALSLSGGTMLKAHIDELPTFVLPMSAESYGLTQSAVREYWERTDPTQLSPIVGVAASYQQAIGMIRQMSPEQKKSTLKVLKSNNQYSQMILSSYEKYGLTREDIIAVLEGRELSERTMEASFSTPQQPNVVTPVVAAAQPKRLSSDVDVDLPTNAATNENFFAVIFANEHYQEEADVEYALNDGEMFSEYCNKVLGLPKENIHIRKDATLNNIKAELSWMQQVAKAYNGNVNFIVFYAGHGVPDEKSSAAYLLPVDGKGTILETGYSLAKFYETLGNMPAECVTVFMDACFSGSKRGDGMLASARGVAIKAKPQAPKGKMVVFSAAQGDETAYPLKDKEHGLFTYFLLKKLKETNGNVTYGELGSYIAEQVSRKSIVVNSKSQTPCVIPSEGMVEDWRTMKLK